MNELFCLDQFDPRQIIGTLSAQGAMSVPLLREDFRLTLLEEARSSTYATEPDVIGSGEEEVHQQVSSRCVIGEGSAYALLRQAFHTVCEEAFSSLAPYPFTTPLRLMELRLQKYAPGSSGITAHRDGSCFCNLVCVFLIGGSGRFVVCADRSGRDARDLDATPGRLLLLRAPGFLGSEERPFHYLTEIGEERYT